MTSVFLVLMVVLSRYLISRCDTYRDTWVTTCYIVESYKLSVSYRVHNNAGRNGLNLDFGRAWENGIVLRAN